MSQETTAPAAPPAVHHRPSGWGRVGLVAVVCAVIVTIIVLAFTWPTKTQETRDLPVSVAGPAATVQQFEDKINEAQPGAFDFHEAADADAVRDQIKTQETLGGIVFHEGNQAPEVYSASAAGNVPKQAMTAVAQNLQKQIRAGIQAKADAGEQKLQKAQKAGATPSAQQVQQLLMAQKAAATTEVTVTDVVSLSDEDPTGAGFAAASFPLILGGILGGVLVNTMVHGLWRRLAAAVGYSVLAGLALTLILHTWFGFVQGDFVVDWMVFILSVLGTSSFILGCTALIGPAGIGIGAIVTMFLGNPLSGAQIPWQFYPHPWGWIGQHLVPGAAQHLLRSESFFPDANTAEQWWTLVFWALLGLVLTIVGYLVHHHGKTNDIAEEEFEERHGVLAQPASGEGSSTPAGSDYTPRHGGPAEA